MGFQRLLDDDPGGRARCVGVVPDLASLPGQCEALRPDVVVFELRPEADATIAECRRIVPTLRLVALHLGRRIDHLEHAQRLDAWLLSYAAAPEVALAVMTGTNSGAARVVDVERRRSNRTLLPVERQVLRLAGEGLSCAEAAERLGLPEDIVRRLAEDALVTLGTDTMQSAVRRAREVGLVPRQQAS